jgi:spore coat polysaccharide biosynthesis protein SpsF
MNKRLVAALACRNQGSRLYAKPMQNLDVTSGIRIIDNIISCLNTLNCIDEVVLGISEGIDNEVFKVVAEEKGLRYVIGDQQDVLSRLVSCGQLANATDIFRVTSESPFLFYNQVIELWERHKLEEADATFMDDVVDGCGFEIISLKCLEESHLNGDERHRSELCTLYIRENSKNYRIIKASPPDSLVRKDLRLTVDNPEDLVLCRAVYQELKHQAPKFNIDDIINFLDSKPNLKALVAPYTESGYSTMYL